MKDIVNSDAYTAEIEQRLTNVVNGSGRGSQAAYHELHKSDHIVDNTKIEATKPDYW